MLSLSPVLIKLLIDAAQAIETLSKDTGTDQWTPLCNQLREQANSKTKKREGLSR